MRESGSNPAHQGRGVYLLDRPSEPVPRRWHGHGPVLERFMDTIYLNRPCEKLTAQQISILNAVRRRLMERPDIGHTNDVVRRAMAAALKASAAGRVLEWGCGYHPMRSLLKGLDYHCLDIDPEVVAAQRRWARRGQKGVYLADAQLGDIEPAHYDAIVSAFVFHFKLPRRHILTMSRVLKPDGFVLANVYRRPRQSRQALIAEFGQVGLAVVRRSDPVRLCDDHEFWFISRKTTVDSGWTTVDSRAGQVLDTVCRHLTR